MILTLMILVEYVEHVRRKNQAKCQEKCGDQRREDSKDDHYFVVKFKHVCAVTLAATVSWKLYYLNNVVDGPKSIRNVIVGIEEE